jgi:hypothetical protein
MVLHLNATGSLCEGLGQDGLDGSFGMKGVSRPKTSPEKNGSGTVRLVRFRVPTMLAKGNRQSPRR